MTTHTRSKTIKIETLGIDKTEEYKNRREKIKGKWIKRLRVHVP